MGLDMYLHAEKYISGFNHSDKTEQALYKKIIKAAEASRDASSLLVSP